MSEEEFTASKRLEKLLEDFLKSDDVTIFDKREVAKLKALISLEIDPEKLKILLALNPQKLEAISSLDASKLKRLQDMDADMLERALSAFGNAESTGKTLNFVKRIMLWISGIGGAILLIRQWLSK